MSGFLRRIRKIGGLTEKKSVSVSRAKAVIHLAAQVCRELPGCQSVVAAFSRFPATSPIQIYLIGLFMRKISPFL